MTNGEKEREASSSQKDAVDVLVVAGRVLGGGGHLEGAQEARDERLQLVHVLLLRLDHAKHQAARRKREARERSCMSGGVSVHGVIAKPSSAGATHLKGDKVPL